MTFKTLLRCGYVPFLSLFLLSSCATILGPGDLGGGNIYVPVPTAEQVRTGKASIVLSGSVGSAPTYHREDGNRSFGLSASLIFPKKYISRSIKSEQKMFSSEHFNLTGLHIGRGSYDLQNDTIPTIRGTYGYTAVSGYGGFVRLSSTRKTDRFVFGTLSATLEAGAYSNLSAQFQGCSFCGPVTPASIREDKYLQPQGELQLGAGLRRRLGNGLFMGGRAAGSLHLAMGSNFYGLNGGIEVGQFNWTLFGRFQYLTGRYNAGVSKYAGPLRFRLGVQVNLR